MSNNVPKETLHNTNNNELEALNVLLLRESNNIDAVTKRAIAKYRLDDYKGALEDLNRADEIEPNNAFTIRNRGVTKRMLDDYEGSLEDLNRADEIEPNNAFTLSYRGETKQKLGDYKGALEDLNRADEIQPNNAFTLRSRGETKQMLDDYEGSLEDLNRADEIEPNNAFTLQNRGETKRMLGDYHGALEDLNRADEIEPNNAFALHSRGATKLQLGDYKGALEDLNRADEIQPNNAFALQNRGETKRMLGDYKGALEDFNRAPNNAFALRSRGATKRMLGDYKGALEDFNRADEIEPNDAFTLKSRGATKRRLEDYQGALEDLDRANEIEPNDTFTLEQQAKVRHHLNDSEQVNPAVIGDSSQKALEADKITVHKPQNATQQLNTVALPAIQEGVIQVPFSALKVIKTLGEGGFGEVSLAEWNGVEVALKKLKSNVVVEDMLHEAKTLMLFRYKFIVVLMGFTTDPATNSTILIMEYMKHGSLEDLLFKQNVKLSRTEVIRLALDIALGVNYLHSHNPKVLHRDLKSANVLLHRNKTRAKIADFGTTKFLHTDVQAKTVVSSLFATPPEMLAEEIYDEKVDVFAFGVVLYEMLTNKRLPILEENPRLKRIRENITDAKLVQLVLTCCTSDPTKRPHMRDIIELLRTMKSEAI